MEVKPEYYILVRNLHIKDGDSYDSLFCYVEAGAKSKPRKEKLIYNKSSLTAILPVEGKPDIDNLKKRTREKPLYDQTITVENVENPEGIVVSCKEDIQAFSLELYFESGKSGGGEIKGKVEEPTDQAFFVIRFNDPKVVRGVCGNVHTLNGNSLRVSPYYEYPGGAIWDTGLHTLSIPGPVKLKIHRNHGTYLKRNCLQNLEDHLKSKHCSFTIRENYVELTCALCPGVADVRRRLRDWPEDVQTALQSFLDKNVEDREFCVAGNVWNELRDSLRSEQNIDLQEEDYDLLGSVDWEQLIDDIQAESVKITKTHSSLKVYGLNSIVNEVMKKCKIFIDENGIKKTSVQCSDIHARYLKQHGNDCLTDLESEHSNEKLKIGIDTHINISATKTGIPVGEKAVKQLLKKIVQKDHTIQKTAVIECYDSEVFKKVENKSRCVVEVHTGPEQLKYLAKAQSPSKQHSNDVQDMSGASRPKVDQNASRINVSIKTDELAKQKAAVLVATASADLDLNRGAVTRNIADVGGPGLQRECRRKYPGRIAHGDIAVIDGGNMACEKVYFTCLPSWPSNGSSKPNIQYLRTVVTDCLKMASQHSKQSICFAAMGSGQLKYPAKEVARAMIHAVNEFKGDYRPTSLTDIRFVLHQNDTEIIQAFGDEMKQTQGGGRSHVDVKKIRERPTEAMVGPTKVELVVRKLEEEKVDCVLVATNKHMSLDQSKLGEALIKKGGRSLQDECKSKHQNKIDVGQVKDISGGNLPCKAVYLTVLPQRADMSDDSIEEELTRIVTTFLTDADDMEYTSAAMPAMGTGYLNYPRDVTCRSLAKAVANLVALRPETTLTTVHIVIHERDKETIAVFHDHLERIEKDRKRSVHVVGPRLLSHEGVEFQKTPNGCQIRGTILKVQKGNLLDTETDAIVSCCTKSLEFDGAVAKEIVKRCPTVQEECQRQKKQFKEKGLMVTESCSLKARNIVFVLAQGTTMGWKQAMVDSLEAAHDHGWESIAFPLIGAGGQNKAVKPNDIAKQLFKAVDQFTKRVESTSVVDVRLVVFHEQLDILEDIKGVIHRKADEVSKEKKGALKRLESFTHITDRMGKFFRGMSSTSESRNKEKKTSSLSVTVYSNDMTNINKCIEMLEEQLEKQYNARDITRWADLVKTLTENEKKMLQDTKLNVDLTIQSSGFITIKGLPAHLVDAISEIEKKLNGIKQDREKKDGAEKLYMQFRWYYETVMASGDELKGYDLFLNYDIETAFLSDKAMYKFHDIEKIVWIVDFNEFVTYQEHDKPATRRKIVRKSCGTGGAAFPDDWVTMGDDENVKIVTLPPEDKRYKDVQKKFIHEINNGREKSKITYHLNTVKITKIEKIQNKSLYQQYEARKKLMENQKPNLPKNMPIERVLWHGTNTDAASSIKTHGFNRSYCGVHGTWYGQGVYFAKDASYSAKGWLSGADQGQSGQPTKGYLFLAKALTGQYVLGNDEMRALQPVDPKNPAVLYDSAVNDVKDPFEFVIFTDTQSYPDFLIEFTATLK